ncbi:MAG: DMT family transporter [Gammaproteobacteria bacterium]|nr:DMT family transporter [Gammaproteobacteria bacterium]
MTPNRVDRILPILCLLTTASIWGVMWYPLRLLDAQGLNGVWTTLIAYATPLIIGIPLAWRHMREFKQYPFYFALVGLASGWCNLAFILAVLDGTVVRALLLFYLSPVWAVLLGHLVVKEHMTRSAKVVVVVAMSGALLMLWEPEIGAPWPRSISDWFAISSGFAFALSNVFVRKRQTVSVASKTITVWLGGVVLAAGWLILTQASWPVVVSGAWIGAVLMGIFMLGLATLAVQYGVTHLPVHQSAVILLFELIVGAVSSELLTNEVVRPIEWIGGALILYAAWVAAREQMD